VLDSDSFWVALKAALWLLVLFNTYVSVRLLFYSGCTLFQKIWQLLIVWLLPIVGGLFVHSLIVVARWKETDHGFARDGGDSPPGIGTGGHE
jgi:hypothetical protein